MSIWDVIGMLILIWGLNLVFRSENPDRPRYWNMADSTQQVEYKLKTEKIQNLDIDSLLQMTVKGQ